MGETTDKTIGRAKQALGAVTGDQETKREGERQEDKGKLKGKLDSTVDKAQDALEDLKDKVDGDIYVSGSGTLVRAMLADGLVDELHLFVYPVARGAGQRLLADSGPATKLALAGSEAYSNGVVHLAYAPAVTGHAMA